MSHCVISAVINVKYSSQDVLKTDARIIHPWYVQWCELHLQYNRDRNGG